MHLHRLDRNNQPEGWFTQREMDCYRELAARFPGGMFVEVGVWLGRSLSAILPFAQRTGATVWAVDTWEGSEDFQTLTGKEGCIVRDLAEKQLDLFEVFRENMRLLGFWSDIRVKRMASVVAAKEFSDESCDLVFVDASHDYRSVSEDIRSWFPKVKPGGILAGHDYGIEKFDVTAAVDDAFGKREPIGSIWIVHKEAHKRR